MIRKIIHIDEDKCNGCGLCAEACHENAIGMVDGKAKLLRDDYCDGLGNCLPACPAGAISFIEREAAAYDHAAVMANSGKTEKKIEANEPPVFSGCPGTRARTIRRPKPAASKESVQQEAAVSELRQWPVQIQLVSPFAPYLQGADLLIAADCTAYACGDFHRRFLRGKVALIGCPKLDEVDYSEKLTEILSNNDIRSITVVRMEVPCCGGIVQAVKTAMRNSGSIIPWQVVTIATDGTILD